MVLLGKLRLQWMEEWCLWVCNDRFWCLTCSFQLLSLWLDLATDSTHIVHHIILFFLANYMDGWKLMLSLRALETKRLGTTKCREPTTPQQRTSSNGTYRFGFSLDSSSDEPDEVQWAQGAINELLFPYQRKDWTRSYAGSVWVNIPAHRSSPVHWNTGWLQIELRFTILWRILKTIVEGDSKTMWTWRMKIGCPNKGCSDSSRITRWASSCEANSTILKGRNKIVGMRFLRQILLTRICRRSVVHPKTPMAPPSSNSSLSRRTAKNSNNSWSNWCREWGYRHNTISTFANLGEFASSWSAFHRTWEKFPVSAARTGPDPEREGGRRRTGLLASGRSCDTVSAVMACICCPNSTTLASTTKLSIATAHLEQR